MVDKLANKVGERIWRMILFSGIKYSHPVIYTNLVSKPLARFYPLNQPPILLLSYPRCGSSWIGKILSYSPDLIYLREPVNQEFQHKFSDWAVIDPYRDHLTRKWYLQFADCAFSGIPSKYTYDMAGKISDFMPHNREGKTLLIKEVNPLAAKLFVDHFRPKIVYILRHPAGVADSFYRMGWLGDNFEQFGYNYGKIQSEATNAIENAKSMIIKFEQLAQHPNEQFIRLYSLLGIKQPENLDKIVNKYSRGEFAGDDPHEIVRDSRSQIYKWRQNLKQDQIDAVMHGYERSGSNNIYPYER